MARISQYKLEDRVYEKLFSLLFEVLGNRNDNEEFHNVLFDLLSPVERIMIAKRVVIIFLLMKGIDYVTICDVLKVSNGTVSKFRLIMEKSTGIVPVLSDIVRNEKIMVFIEGLFNDLYAPGIPGVNWKSAWQNKINLQRKKSQGI